MTESSLPNAAASDLTCTLQLHFDAGIASRDLVNYNIFIEATAISFLCG